MKIKLTDKAQGIPLASFIEQGWTPETLVEHGYAVEVVAEPDRPVKWKPLNKITEWRPAILPNAFGLTHPDQVQKLWKEVSPPSLYLDGYSFEQQLVFVAELMAGRNEA